MLNLVEGVIDRAVRGMHQVRDDLPNPLPMDLTFLAFGTPPAPVGLR